MAALEELRASRRLRLGLAAILAILVGYGLLEWRDQLAADQASYRSLLNQVARLGQLEQPQLWAQRASEAGVALQQAQGRLWRQDTSGQAQAQVQDWLLGQLRQTDAKATTIRVTEAESALDVAGLAQRLPPALQSLKPIRARVEFNSDPLVLLGLLAALNDAEHQVVVDSLVVKPVKTELVVTFWFEIAPSPGARKAG
jgi:hypothetical protein